MRLAGPVERLAGDSSRPPVAHGDPTSHGAARQPAVRSLNTIIGIAPVSYYSSPAYHMILLVHCSVLAIVHLYSPLQYPVISITVSLRLSIYMVSYYSIL